MNKKVTNRRITKSTQRATLRGTNRGAHSHFHAG